MLDFGFDSSVSAVSNSKRLAPWGIYPVKFEGCTVVEFQGKKDPTKKYKVLRIRFEGEDGYYEESVFFPQEGDNIRQKFTNAEGHEYETPSNWERTKFLIAQLATVINPEGFKKMQEISGKFKSFDDMCKALIAITDPKKGMETNIKLIGRNRQDGSIDAVLPRIVGISREGKLFVSDNFIGNKLFFSPYEEQKRAQYLNAKPTKMPDTPADDFATMTSGDTTPGLDMDDLASLI